jgi:hypothetical protein
LLLLLLAPLLSLLLLLAPLLSLLLLPCLHALRAEPVTKRHLPQVHAVRVVAIVAACNIAASTNSQENASVSSLPTK